MNKEILKLAVPAIFNNITVPLLGLSDTAISGHLGSDAFLAAMAVGSTMFNVIFMLCGFLRMGTTGLAAKAYGAGNESLARDILRKAIFIAAGISFIVLIFQDLIAGVLIKTINANQEVTMFARKYFSIVVWSVPAQLVIMAISGWFIGRRNTVVPMIVSVGINVINIAASVLLVFKYDLGFTGVAVGTLTANWIGMFGMLGFLFRELHRNRIVESKSKAGWITFFKVNSNLFFRSACIMGVSLMMTSIGASIGETTLAANTVLLQFFLFFSYFMDGFAFAGEALVGNSAGANDTGKLRQVVCHLVGWGICLAATFTVGYLCLGSEIIALLSDSEAVRIAAGEIKGWLVALPAVTVWAFIFDGVFIGLTRTRPLLVVTLIGASIFLIISECGGKVLPWAPNSILWCAFEAYLMARGVLLALKYLILQRKFVNFVE